MLRVYPFAALRPRPEAAATLASVPYDVVDRDESRALGFGRPNDFIHVVRPDADLPDDIDAYDERVYARGAENLHRLLTCGVLQKDDHRRLYLYRQQGEFAGRFQSQTGLVCCCDVRDYDEDRIKKHEKTRKVKEDDRVRTLLTQSAHAEPVFLTYRARPSIDRIIARASDQDPLYDFESADGVRHTVWHITDADAARLVEEFRHVPCGYVADGHHRSAAASRAAAERKAKNPRHTGDEEYNRFLSVLFPAEQLLILPYHRVVSELNGLSPEAFLDRVRAVASLEKTPTAPDLRPGSFGLYLGNQWWRATFPEDTIRRDDPVAGLDVSLLSDRVLEPVLGITDVRTDKRIDFVGGARGTGELERLVRTGRAAAAFAMSPTTMDQLLAIADAGEIMPPKSTWFEPKLRSGLLVHMLD